MRSEDLTNEVAGLLGRLSVKLRTDPRYTTVLQRDTEDQSRELILSGIEDAILGLVMLHIQVRREFSGNTANR